MADPVDELLDELGLPRTPGRRPGRQRVGLRQHVEQGQHPRRADGRGHRADRPVVAQVPAGGDVGQQQVVAHERGQHVDVGPGQAEAVPDALDQVDTDDRVVPRVPLAEVVEERAEHEEVGPRDPVGELGRVGRRLPQVPVDGVAVVGVALGPGPDGRPLGQQARDQVPLVQRLEHGDGVVALQEQGDQVVAGPGRPRIGPRRHLGRQPLEGAPVDVEPLAGRGRGDAQEQGRVTRGVGVVVQADLAEPGADTGGDGLLPSVPLAELALRDAHPVPRLVADPRDRAGRGADRGHQQVGVGEPEPGRHPVLVLQRQHITRAAGQAVQLDAGGQQHLVGLAQRLLVALGQQVVGGQRRPRQGVDVAEPSPPLLQVGLEQEGHLAVLRVALVDAAPDPVQPRAGPLPPLRPGAVGQAGRQRRVPGDVADGQQRGRGVEVARRPGAAPP